MLIEGSARYRPRLKVTDLSGARSGGAEVAAGGALFADEGSGPAEHRRRPAHLGHRPPELTGPHPGAVVRSTDSWLCSIRAGWRSPLASVRCGGRQAVRRQRRRRPRRDRGHRRRRLPHGLRTRDRRAGSGAGPIRGRPIRRPADVGPIDAGGDWTAVAGASYGGGGGRHRRRLRHQPGLAGCRHRDHAADRGSAAAATRSPGERAGDQLRRWPVDRHRERRRPRPLRG